MLSRALQHFLLEFKDKISDVSTNPKEGTLDIEIKTGEAEISLEFNPELIKQVAPELKHFSVERGIDRIFNPLSPVAELRPNGELTLTLKLDIKVQNQIEQTLQKQIPCNSHS